MKHKSIRLIVTVTFIAGLLSCSTNAENKPNGFRGGILVYNTGVNFGNKPVNIHYYIPSGDTDTMPFQIILHGAGRNADEYLAGWKGKADEYGIIIVAPEFSRENFEPSEYYEGMFLDSEGNINEPAFTTFSVIDRIFEFTKEQLELSNTYYNIFGHSAGGQFVHRFMEFYDSPFVNKAVASNAGWYTFPDESVEYPYGIKDLYVNNDSLRLSYYTDRLIILLGTADTIRDSNLRTTPEADNQGLTRFERGNSFFGYNQLRAAEENMEFNWILNFVTDAGHDHTLMSPAAADLLYDTKGNNY